MDSDQEKVPKRLLRKRQANHILGGAGFLC